MNTSKFLRIESKYEYTNKNRKVHGFVYITHAYDYASSILDWKFDFKGNKDEILKCENDLKTHYCMSQLFPAYATKHNILRNTGGDIKVIQTDIHEVLKKMKNENKITRL